MGDLGRFEGLMIDVDGWDGMGWDALGKDLTSGSIYSGVGTWVCGDDKSGKGIYRWGRTGRMVALWYGVRQEVDYNKQYIIIYSRICRSGD